MKQFSVQTVDLKKNAEKTTILASIHCRGALNPTPTVTNVMRLFELVPVQLLQTSLSSQSPAPPVRSKRLQSRQPSSIPTAGAISRRLELPASAATELPSLPVIVGIHGLPSRRTIRNRLGCQRASTMLKQKRNRNRSTLSKAN